MLLKKYLCSNSNKSSNIFLITYKTAVTLKIPAIFFLIDCENSGLLCSKIYQQSNSLVFLIEKTYSNKNYFGEYILDLNIISVKQILFILTIIKQIKNTDEIIQKI